MPKQGRKSKRGVYAKALSPKMTKRGACRCARDGRLPIIARNCVSYEANMKSQIASFNT